jgi:hypothetical protein
MWHVERKPSSENAKTSFLGLVRSFHHGKGEQTAKYTFHYLNSFPDKLMYLFK